MAEEDEEVHVDAELDNEGINMESNDEEKLVKFEEMFQNALGVVDKKAGLSIAPYVTQQIREMEAIELSGNNSLQYRFTDDCVHILVECLINCNIMIQSISLRHHRLTSEAVKHLSLYYLQSLRLLQIDLEGNDVDSEGAELLATWLLSEHCNMLSLNLSCNPIGERGGFCLADALKLNCNLERILLNNCELNLKTVIAIITCISGNNQSRISHMDLGRPLLKATKNEELCDHLTTRLMLAPGTMMQMLDLKHCNIGDKGAVLLAQALMFNSAVKYLNVESNRISVSGAEALASYLIERPNNGLEVLKMSSNQIADEGFHAFADALENNASLQELTLKSNRAKESGLMALGNSLYKNSTLKLLTVLGNDFNDNSAKLFGELCRDRFPFTNMTVDVQVYIVDGVHLVAEVQL